MPRASTRFMSEVAATYLGRSSGNIKRSNPSRKNNDNGDVSDDEEGGAAHPRRRPGDGGGKTQG
jgi:hypothetical protein